MGAADVDANAHGDACADDRDDVNMVISIMMLMMLTMMMMPMMMIEMMIPAGNAQSRAPRRTHADSIECRERSPASAEANV
eukprot:4665272-Pyramimonas_sp.AAC.2